jgi:acetophenone carboxylase
VKNIYRVAYDHKRLRLYIQKTKERRQEERNARLARGKSFDDFQKEWSTMRPPQDILQFYGSWPDAKSLGPVFRP